MALEDLTGPDKFISSLVSTNPAGRPDQVAQGDDHLRGIKNVLLNTFPALAGPVALSDAQLNALAELQIGMVGHFIWNPTAANPGWQVLDGHNITRAQFPRMFALLALPGDTYALPDLRGEFVRALSLGRSGVDAGRALLSAQPSSLGTEHAYGYLTGQITGNTLASPAAGANLSLHLPPAGSDLAPRNVALYPAVWCGFPQAGAMGRRL